VVKVIWHKAASPPHTDGSVVFAKWRPPMRARWRHLVNPIELVLPSAHPSPQPKRQINRFSLICTANSRKSLYFTVGAPVPKNCPFLWGLWSLIQHMIPSAHLSPIPNAISIGWAVFAQTTAESLYFTMGCHFPPQNCPFPWGMWSYGPHLIHGSLGPTKSLTQTVSRSLQPFLQGSLVWQTDRQTTLLSR